MEPLLVWVIQRCDDFPKKHKFSVADRWIDACLEAETVLVEATYVREKRGLLLQASRALVRARVLARVSTTLRALSNEQLAHFERESVEIGKMIGGWLRAIAHRPAGNSVTPAERSAPRGEVGQAPTG
jgi:hypothetical protein